MKKVMIGILVIIPVIIVLVVALVSVFVSARTHIAVDDITLDKNYVEVEFDSSNSVYKLSDLFAVTVTPDRATNKNYTWTIENLVCIDEDYKEMWNEGTAPAPALLASSDTRATVEDNTCSQDGFLHINSYCSFILKAQAETHVATCRVYVVGYKVEDITIVVDNEMTVGDSALMQIETTPIDAKIDDMVFASSDESILAVDKNGVITAVGEGSATITATVGVHGTEDHVSDSITITVSKGATVLGNSVTTASSEVIFSTLGINAKDVIVVSGAVLNSAGDGILLTGDAILDVSGETVTVTKCEEGAIVINNAELFTAQDEGGYVLATGGKALYLTASFADDFASGTPTVAWSSNRETVATVNEHGVVTGVSNGRAIITATANGKSFSVEINVREIVTVLLIETPEACAEEGIARETVNGSMVYAYANALPGVTDLTTYAPTAGDFDFTKKNNSFAFNFMRPTLPEGANLEEFYSAFNFEAFEYVGEGDDRQLVKTDKAFFNSNTMVFDSEKIDGYTEIIVRISAKYPKFASRPEYTTTEFTVKVTKGVSVSSYLEALAVCEEGGLDLCFARNIERADGWAMEDEIIVKLEAINAKIAEDKKLKAEEQEMWDEYGGLEGLRNIWKMRDYSRGTTLNCDDMTIYGNGKMLNGYKAQYWGTWNCLVRITTGNVKISNVILRACEVGDVMMNDAADTQGLDGSCVIMESADYNNNALRMTDVFLEYSIIENAGTPFRTYNADYTLNGCIVRNASETAIAVRAKRDETGVMYSHININNCIFSNMLGTAMSAQFKDYCDGSPEQIAEVEQLVAEGKTIIINQTGFWDIYNWQPTNVLNLIPGIDDVVNGMIRAALEESDEFREYSRFYDNTEYFHLGFIVSGFGSLTQVEYPYVIYNLEDERIQTINTNDILPSAGTAGGILQGALKGQPIYLFTYGQNGDITPGSTYEVNNRLIRHLHGEI